MLIYGHRGARAEAPENTLASFSRALQAGVDRVELDLHLARDGELVVIHDPTLERTTNGRGKVARFDSKALWALDARRGGPEWPEPQGVPTITQVLDAFPSMRHYQLECKPAGPAERRKVALCLLSLYTERNLYERATVTSFDPLLLAEVRRVAPEIPLGLVADRVRPDPVQTAVALGAWMVALDWRLCSEKRIAAGHAAGLHVSAWTVNKPDIARMLGDRGLDSLITDVPTLMRAALAR
jgi:glycerophosphoryl diester phosphodiesterase